MTISCQPDGRPPQPVRRWKSGRVHLADGSNVVVLELPFFGFFAKATGCTVRPIWTNEGSKRVVPLKEVPFGGLNDVPLNFWAVKSPQN